MYNHVVGFSSQLATSYNCSRTCHASHAKLAFHLSASTESLSFLFEGFDLYVIEHVQLQFLLAFFEVQLALTNQRLLGF